MSDANTHGTAPRREPRAHGGRFAARVRAARCRCDMNHASAPRNVTPRSATLPTAAELRRAFGLRAGDARTLRAAPPSRALPTAAGLRLRAGDES